MITKEERLYYIQPVPKPVNLLVIEGLKVLVIANRYNRPDPQPGDIVDVNNVYIEDDIQWYNTTDGGRHVMGHAVNNHHYNYPQQLIGLVGDNLFGLVTMHGRSPDNKLALGQVARWSDPTMSTSLHGNGYGTFAYTAQAAPWAYELMPEPGDPDEVVRAKVEQAKVRWDHMRKGLGLIHEGLRREWLHLLSELRANHSQFMPEPRFSQYASGTVMIPTTRVPTTEQLQAARERMARNGVTEEPLDNTLTFVTTPATAVLAADQTYDDARRQNGSDEFTRAMQARFSDTQVRAFVTHSSPVLSSLVY